MKDVSYLREESDIKKLENMLPESERNKFRKLIDSVDQMNDQFEQLKAENQVLKERVNRIHHTISPFIHIVEYIEKIVKYIQIKLEHLKDSICSFAKQSLETLKDASVSAFVSTVQISHIRDDLQSMSTGLTYCVTSLNKAIVKVDDLVQKHQEKQTEYLSEESQESVLQEEKTIIRIGLLSGNLNVTDVQKEDLKEVYQNLLVIGMGNELSVIENNHLPSILNEIEGLLPNQMIWESEQYLETEQEQG